MSKSLRKKILIASAVTFALAIVAIFIGTLFKLQGWDRGSSLLTFGLGGQALSLVLAIMGVIISKRETTRGEELDLTAFNKPTKEIKPQYYKNDELV